MMFVIGLLIGAAIVGILGLIIVVPIVEHLQNQIDASEIVIDLLNHQIEIERKERKSKNELFNYSEQDHERGL